MTQMFVAPAIDWGVFLPLLIVLGAGIIGVVVEAFVSHRSRRNVGMFLALIAIAAALVVVAWRWTVVASLGAGYGLSPANGQGLYTEDPVALAAQGVLLIIALLAMLVIGDRTQTGEGAFAAQAASRPGSLDEADATRMGLAQTEVFPLTLFSLGGMMVFTAANDFLTLFVALELLSLPLYVLSAMARRRRLLSQEAAAKYFILGAFTSGFFLLGIVLLYGYSGSLRMGGVTQAVPVVAGMDWILLVGITLVIIGLLFKVGAVPFHAWTPDVYQGAPTPITGFMAAATKLAAFIALVRVVYVVGSGLQWYLTPAFAVIIVVTMLVGTVVGIVQTDIKRMLAYSSIAHAGFILIAVTSLHESAVPGVLFYLLAYGIATVGAFALVTLVRERDAEGNITGEATALYQWKGLGKSHPLVAIAMTVFLLSFAGIPLTAGFVGKFAVFAPALSSGQPLLVTLVVLAILASAATAFFYFRLIVFMFFHDASEDNATVVGSEGLSAVAIGIATIATIVLGVIPGSVLGLLSDAAVFLL